MHEMALIPSLHLSIPSLGESEEGGWIVSGRLIGCFVQKLQLITLRAAMRIRLGRIIYARPVKHFEYVEKLATKLASCGSGTIVA